MNKSTMLLNYYKDGQCKSMRSFFTSKHFYVFLFAFCIFPVAAELCGVETFNILAQESKTVKTDTLKTANINQPNSPQAEEGDVKITDGTNTLIRITDEGTFGAIEIKNGVPSVTTDKLYNDAGTLKFDGTALGGGNGATEINELSDGKSDGSSVFLGSSAGANDDGSDNRNTGLGKSALLSLTTGEHNVGVGYKALRNINTGIGNISLGSNSLFSNTTGNYNVAIGQGSQYFLTTGIKNIAIGFQANVNNTEGNNNTIIGHLAGGGGASHIKSGNVFIGYNAGYGEISNNKLYIENSNSSSPLIWGDFANDSVRINGTFDVTTKIISPLLQITTGATNGHVLTSDATGNASWQTIATGDTDWTVAGNDIYSTQSGNVGIGTSTPSEKLEINGKTKTAQLQVTTGATDGYVLTSDATGTATWQAASGSGATEINDLSDAIYDGSSIFLGSGTGANDDGTNNSNTAVGRNALTSNTTGSSNDAIGSLALFSNTTGNNNIAHGYTALFSNITGGNNTAIGNSALKSNTSASNNTAIGKDVLFSNTTGNSNVGIGNNANYYNQQGSNNTIIGFEAGKGTTLHNKTGNIFLGYKAGFNEGGNNKLYIENTNSNTPLIWGDFLNDSVRINGTFDVTTKTITPLLQISMGAVDNYVLTSDANGNATWQANVATADNDWTVSGNDMYSGPTGKIGLGTSSPTTKLEVNGKTKTTELQIPSGATNGYVLTSDASGNATWQAGGANEINDLTDAITDGSSVFLGNGAGSNDNGSNSNTAIGSDALNSNTSGNNNTASGRSALISNITGSYNSAIGKNALQSNTIGQDNTAQGYNALGQNTIGNYNVGIGVRANYNNNEGSYNTIIGYEAGMGTSIQNKTGNIFLGYQAGFQETGSDKLYIENSNSTTPLIWGDFLNNKVKINGSFETTSKIKTTSIQVTDGATDGYVLTSDASGNASWQVNSGDGDWHISGNDMYSTPTGNVGIGVTSGLLSKLNVGGGGPANGAIFGADENYGLYGIATGNSGKGVYGYASYSASTAFTYGGYFKSDAEAGTGAYGEALADNGTGLDGRAEGLNGVGVHGNSGGIDGIGLKGTASNTNGTGVLGNGSAFDFNAVGPGVNYGTTSSIRWKRNIVEIEKPLEKLAKLRGVYYDWDEEHGGGHDVGCIAEEVGKVLPEIVIYEENGIDAIGMDYSKLTPLLIEVTKTLAKQNSDLKEEVDQLKILLKKLVTKNNN